MRVAIAMAMLNLIIDIRTGETSIQGRDGSVYTLDHVELIRARAQAGNAEAIARLREIEYPDPTNTQDARKMLEHAMDDCPECRAARARGETPMFGDGAPPFRARRGIDRFKRPRWRTLKRFAGRR